MLLVKPFLMLAFFFFFPSSVYFIMLQNLASPQKMQHSGFGCLVWFGFFCSVSFLGHVFPFPQCFAEADVWQYCLQPLKLHLIMKTLLFVLILSRYQQIGIFTLVIEASCVPGRDLFILSRSLSTLHRSIFLSALNMLRTSWTL